MNNNPQAADNLLEYQPRGNLLNSMDILQQAQITIWIQIIKENTFSHYAIVDVKYTYRVSHTDFDGITFAKCKQTYEIKPSIVFP